VNRKLTRLALIGAGASLLLAACGGGAAPSAEADNVLRIAMGSPGEAQIRVWDDVAAQFMAAHPETTVEINYQQDDLYQTIGLQNLLAGRNAPDIYFEWTGERLNQRNQDGYVADITDQFANGPLNGLFSDDTLTGFSIDDKVVMVPYSSDVTNVLWYNRALLADAGVEPPTTWDELLAACTALNEAGITPIATGNKDLWPAGNWFGHLASRVVGEDVYDATLAGTGKFATPEWETAFGYIKQLADAGCVNESANAIDDNGGAQLFFQGKAAMHPIGSWLVSWAIDEAPDLDFDYVNLPAMPDGSAGNQDSVIGVATGYIINAKSAKQDQAAEFMALLNSPENIQALIEAEVTPLAISASEGQEIDGRSASLSSLLNNAPAVVLPPDTGYDLKTADALYQGIAAVLGGQATPADALAEIDRVLGR
jgi:raffinose/stachyose/melibiose transport system substrate-binding protein